MQQHPNNTLLYKIHTPTHVPLSKTKCSWCGGGIMLDMWSRSCSVLVIPKLRGLSLAAAWICILSLSLSSFLSITSLPLSLFVWLPLYHDTGREILEKKAENKSTVGGNEWDRTITLKKGMAVFFILSSSNLLIRLLQLSYMLLNQMRDYLLVADCL